MVAQHNRLNAISIVWCNHRYQSNVQNEPTTHAKYHIIYLHMPRRFLYCYIIVIKKLNFWLDGHAYKKGGGGGGGIINGWHVSNSIELIPIPNCSLLYLLWTFWNNYSRKSSSYKYRSCKKKNNTNSVGVYNWLKKIDQLQILQWYEIGSRICEIITL